MKNAIMPKHSFLTMALLFVISAGYLGYRIIPVYVEQDAFHDGLLSIAGKATRYQWNNRKIVSQVAQLAESKKFDIERRDIRIQRVRGRSEVSLVVNYTRAEEFPGGYTYVFDLRSTALGSYWF